MVRGEKGFVLARPALSATRAIEIVNFLASHPTESFTLSDLVDRLGVNVASLHAVLGVLTESGYLARHPRHRTYTLGPALVAVGSVALEQHPVVDAAREESRRLSKDLTLDVAITARAGTEVVFVARSGTHRPRGTPAHVGMRMPIRPPMASVFFAWADQSAIREWLDLGPEATDEERRRDLEELRFLRTRGYSVALEGDVRREIGDVLEEIAEHPGRGSRDAVDELFASAARRTQHLMEIDPRARYDVSSLSAPVFDSSAQVVLAINLIGFAPGLSGSEVMSYGDEALKAGLIVSKRTRGNPPAELLAQVSVG